MLIEPLETEEELRRKVVAELKAVAFASDSDHIHLAAKLRSLELLAKHLGMFREMPPETKPLGSTSIFDVKTASAKELQARLLYLEQRKNMED